MHQYQKNRVLVFLNPERDPLGAGYHILQSKIAIGSGGLFGKGWLHGTQSHLKFLPEHHLLVTSSEDKSLIFWETKTGQRQFMTQTMRWSTVRSQVSLKWINHDRIMIGLGHDRWKLFWDRRIL